MIENAEKECEFHKTKYTERMRDHFDQPTNGGTDIASYGVAFSQLATRVFLLYS